MNVKLTLSIASIFCLLGVISTNVDSEKLNIVDQERKKVIDLVEKAKKYIEVNGKEKAMREFNKRSDKFSKGSSYIFALAYDSTYLATINYPDMVGVNQFSLKDPLRTFFSARGN